MTAGSVSAASVRLDTYIATIRVDVGLLPLFAHQAGGAAVARLYYIIKDIDTQGSGYVAQNAVYEALTAYKIYPSQRTFRGWLKDGERLGAWQRHGPKLRLTAKHKLYSSLVATLDTSQHELAHACLPSSHEIWIDASGSPADFMARCKNARHTLGKGGQETHSRDWQSRLWNRSKPALMDWEQRAGTAVRFNDEQTADARLGRQWMSSEGQRPVYIYKTPEGGRVWKRQTVNTYKSGTETEIHPHRSGQRKRRQFAKQVYEETFARPADLCAGGQRPHRIFFIGKDWQTTQKALQRDVKWTDDPQRMRLGFLGEDKKGRGQFERYNAHWGLLFTEVIEWNNAIGIFQPHLGEIISLMPNGGKWQKTLPINVLEGRASRATDAVPACLSSHPTPHTTSHTHSTDEDLTRVEDFVSSVARQLGVDVERRYVSVYDGYALPSDLSPNRPYSREMRTRWHKAALERVAKAHAAGDLSKSSYAHYERWLSYDSQGRRARKVLRWQRRLPKIPYALPLHGDHLVQGTYCGRRFGHDDV